MDRKRFTMSALYLTQDLFFSSRVTGAATACALQMSVVADGDQLLAGMQAGSVHFVLLDFSTPGLNLLDLVPRIRAAASTPVSVIAFGPHVNVAGMAAAKQAGCDEVYTRGQFNNQMVDILHKHGCTV